MSSTVTETSPRGHVFLPPGGRSKPQTSHLIALRGNDLVSIIEGLPLVQCVQRDRVSLYPDALTQIDRSIEIAGSVAHPAWLANRSVVLLGLGNWEEARATLKAALKIESGTNKEDLTVELDFLFDYSVRGRDGEASKRP